MSKIQPPLSDSSEEEGNDEGPLGYKRSRKYSDSSGPSKNILTARLTRSQVKSDISSNLRLPKTHSSNGSLESQPTLRSAPKNVRRAIQFDLTDGISDPKRGTSVVKVTNKTAVKVQARPARDFGIRNGGSISKSIGNSSTILGLQEVLSHRDIMATFLDKNASISDSLPSVEPKKVVQPGFQIRNIRAVKLENKVSYWKIPKGGDPVTETGRIDWDSANDEVIVDEVVDWIPPEVCDPLETRLLSTWRKVGTKKTDYDSETHFASPNIMSQILESKTALHKVDDMLRIEARLKSNPFETIRSGIFMNRAAMKMANIDAVLGFSLTQPKTEGGAPFVQGNDLLYFADVCAGPGGFSEYVLWRKKWEAKGFGFTLKGEENDFDLENFIAGPSESFETHYGKEGDGNILNPANVSSFVNHVLSCTDRKGVHFMMADGGFAVDGVEEKQELLTKSLVLSQFLVALGIVRLGGHFICKMFDAFTPFSVGLIYIMYRCFDLVAIHKPNSSRPANSERYLICKWKREQTDEAREYLAECQEMFWNWSIKSAMETRDILELVPLDILTKEDHPFYKYIYDSNNRMGKRQIQALQKLSAFCHHPALLETRQKETRLACLDMWGIPDEKRKVELPELPLTRFALHKGSYPPGLLTEIEKDLTTSNLEQAFKSPYDWRFVIVEGDQKRRNRGFYFGMGGSRVYRFDNFVWREVGVKFELSKDTCVFGEIVHEICKSTNSTKVSFHIIDALVLGGKDIRGCHYTLRHELCSKFAKAMDKPSRPDLVSVRVKNLMRLENISEIFEKLIYREVKSSKEDSGYASKLACPINFADEQSDLIHPAGVVFLKITKDPWLMALSRSANRKYWFNTMTSSSVFNIPESAVADFQYTVKNRIVWWWDKNTRVNLINTLLDGSGVPNNNKVHAGQMVRHVQSLLCHTIR